MQITSSLLALSMPALLLTATIAQTDRVVCLLWRSLKCYTYSQGDRQSRLTSWDSPLSWLNWPIPAAQTCQYWAIAAEMLGDRAWKLQQ